MHTPDRGMRGECIATRSARADEAYTDEARVVFDPDYASKTDRSVRTSAIPRPQGSSW